MYVYDQVIQQLTPILNRLRFTIAPTPDERAYIRLLTRALLAAWRVKAQREARP